MKTNVAKQTMVVRRLNKQAARMGTKIRINLEAIPQSKVANISIFWEALTLVYVILLFQNF